jgi:hypothetical protein
VEENNPRERRHNEENERKMDGMDENEGRKVMIVMDLLESFP